MAQEDPQPARPSLPEVWRSTILDVRRDDALQELRGAVRAANASTTGAGDCDVRGYIYKGRNDWETPPWLFERLHEEMGFDVDAAAQAHNAKLRRFWTPETDGLRQSWRGLRVFCNPPYLGGSKVHWVAKAVEETLHGGCPLSVLLLPADIETFWWHDVLMSNAAEIRFVRGRVRFLLGGKAPPYGRPVFNSAVVVFRGGGRGGAPLVVSSLVAPDPRTLWHGRTKRQQGQKSLDQPERIE